MPVMLIGKNIPRVCALGMCALLLAVITSARSQPSNETALQPPLATSETPYDLPGLENIVAFHDGFYSGGVPKGDAGFTSLASLGIKTIISVDGGIPDVVRANRCGIRYVHLPIGYDGIDEKRQRELVRAVRDLPKPIYLHCHHGKHRSAGAAATIGISLKWLTNEQAAARMKVSGTAASYTGLWSCAATAAPMIAAAIDAASGDFPEITKPDSFVAAMVEIDIALDHLKLVQKNGWTVPADHPDLAPAADAGKIADYFRLIAAPANSTLTHDALEEMRMWMARDVATATALEQQIVSADAKRRAGNISEETLAAQRAEMTKLMKQLGASCKECHVKYRD